MCNDPISGPIRANRLLMMTEMMGLGSIFIQESGSAPLKKFFLFSLFLSKMGREQHNMSSIVWKTLQLIRGQYDDRGGLFRRIRNRAHGRFPSLKLRDSRLQKWGSAISLWRRKKKREEQLGSWPSFLKSVSFVPRIPLFDFQIGTGNVKNVGGVKTILRKEPNLFQIRWERGEKKRMRGTKKHSEHSWGNPEIGARANPNK